MVGTICDQMAITMLVVGYSKHSLHSDRLYTVTVQNKEACPIPLKITERGIYSDWVMMGGWLMLK